MNAQRGCPPIRTPNARPLDPDAPRSQRGFTLVELMVAAAVGLLLVAGVMTVYIQAGNSNMEMSRLNQQMENGRFALQLLREDLWHAGYWGEYSSTAAPAGDPPLCSAFSTWSAADQANFLAMPVMGYNNGVGLPAVGGGDDCTVVVTNRVAGTDVLVVRHASTCFADTGTDNNCEDFAANKLYLQVSLCCADFNTLCGAITPGPGYLMTTDPDAGNQAPFTLRRRDPAGNSCTGAGYTTTFAGRRKVISHIYYIRDWSTAVGDGIPTLVRSELDLAGGVVQQQAANPLIEGIEYMELEYGVDSDGDGDVNTFTPDPATLGNWGTVDTPAEKWANVVAIKLHLLARALEATPGHTDTKTYQLGPTQLGPFPDGFNRHVYSTYIRLNNPAGRRGTS